MDWPSVAQGIFYFLALAVSVWVGRSIDEMRKSVESLNIKMAVYVERSDNHEKRITKLEDKE